MSLTSIVRRAAQVNARGPAVIDSPVRTSWSAFADRVSRVAGGLVARGLRPGDRVAILAVNHADFWEKMTDPGFVSDEELWALRYNLRRLRERRCRD